MSEKSAKSSILTEIGRNNENIPVSPDSVPNAITPHCLLWKSARTSQGNWKI